MKGERCDGRLPGTASMTAPAAPEALVFDRAGLDQLVEALIADGYQVIGPTVRDSAIVLDELAWLPQACGSMTLSSSSLAPSS